MPPLVARFDPPSSSHLLYLIAQAQQQLKMDHKLEPQSHYMDNMMHCTYLFTIHFLFLQVLNLTCQSPMCTCHLATLHS